MKLRDQRLWDAAVQGWVEFQESGRDLYRNILVPKLLSTLDPLLGKTILDLGCGHGSMARRLASNGALVCAVDLSPEMIRLARIASSHDHPNIQYILGDAGHMPDLACQTFDDILCVFSLQSMCDSIGVLSESLRLCKVRGMMHLSLFYPGVFSHAYRPANHQQAMHTFSMDDDEEEVLLRWAPTGVSTVFESMTYFRPLRSYLETARRVGFEVFLVSCWDKTGTECSLAPSARPRVVEIVFQRPRA